MEPINIPKVQVHNVGIYQLPTYQIRQPFLPNFAPVTNYIGFPIVDIPGCVEMHKDNKRHKNGVPIDKDLVANDPEAAMTVCPAGEYPSYNAMNYEPEQLTIIRETPPPPVSPPPDPPDTPETPDTGDTVPKDPPCPAPNQPRIGTLGPNEKEKVSGYELQPDPVNQGRKICVILYEDIGAVEQYLPSAQVASTTAVIATVAGASALLAKPLAELLLRVFRPAIKQVLTKANAILGKTAKVRPNVSMMRTDQYRKKRNLPPVKW